MSKFVKTEFELKSELDNWLWVIKNMSGMDKIPLYLRKPVFEKLFNIAAYSNLTKEEKAMYDSSLKRKWDNKNVLDYARKEGREEGRVEGKEEGREEGRVEGKMEGIKETARKLKKSGIDIELIADATGLSLAEIEEL